MPDPTTATLARKNRRLPLKSRWTYRRALKIPTGGTLAPDYVIIGTLTPDVTGNYFQDGTINGYPKYKHQTLNWWIWSAVGGQWHYVNETPGTITGPRWVKPLSTGFPGLYVPTEGASGTMLVMTP